ncbi:carboxypeptidase regulatory-like domain-containing protein [Asanoa sp. WMMD1127]|uniref:carboxypeptidase regulatory-like domain-containing protein n=1 Tax=Asanoa sp. WMMD1127 TaxID=3016107 RepID=UPI0024174761|nr:carboxypeptidase regulatory-like domain-containing protein [Asanoa sp. WMMD1127]MDG4822061.1 carboxypeptidase regulatory-like domain-containing protein [Asanoa sp. WMMD1127]
MTKQPKRRLTAAALAAALLATSVAGWATPAQAAATGAISGHVTTAAGAPAEDVWVQALDAETYEGMGFTTTAADGSYRIDALADGQYIVSFNGPELAEQYFDGKTRINEADPVTVTGGRTTTVDEDLIAAGYLTGHISDPNGEGLDNSLVRIYRAEDEAYVQAVGTSYGDFRVPVPPGTYVLSFEPVKDLDQEQYVPGKLTAAAAQRFVVTAGEDTTVIDTALRTGTLSGRVTRADGTPARDVRLDVSPFMGNGGGEYATTDSNGEFSAPPMLAGDYMVEFSVGERTEYFDRAARYEDADPVTITGGNDSRITPTLLPTGSVRVRALDAVTGSVVRDFCANSECSDGSGEVLLTDLAEGSQDLWISAPEANYVDRNSTVTVRVGQTIDVTVRLVPGAKITTTVVDKATGKPLQDVCLIAYKPGQFFIPDGMGGNECSDAAGKATVDKLATGDYRLFAWPRNRSYGRQWVTANGGSGDERQAVTIKATMGKTSAGPQVRVDRGGSIRGRVTDATTGAPISWTQVGIASGRTGGDTSTDEDGRFQIDGLGPYRWPLQYWGGSDHATAWTGGAVSRYTATGTQVTAGAVATADLALTKGVTVQGNLHTGGHTPDWARITLANTVTRDDVGSVDFVGNSYEMHVLPGQEVRFAYNLDIDGVSYRSDKAPLPPAAPGGPTRYAVTVPDGGLTIDLTIAIP